MIARLSAVFQSSFRSFSTAMTNSGPVSILGTSRLQGKNVMITGASGGIGKSTAILFARTGANVILCARRKEALDEAVKECEAAYKAQGTSAGEQGGKFASLVLDMRDRKGVNEILQHLPSWASQLDIFVANAGLVRGKEPVGDLKVEEIEEVFDTNVTSFVIMNQHIVKKFKAQNSGHLITLGSIAGREAYPNGAIYCASKFAVNAFTSSVLKELVHTPVSGEIFLQGDNDEYLKAYALDSSDRDTSK